MTLPSIRTSLFATAALVLSGTSAFAGEIKLNSLMTASDEDRWKSWTYIANDTVSSLNDVSSGLTVRTHDALNMDEASSWARFGFVITAGQINTRIQNANSIFFGHEFAHFQNAHRFGMTDHYFVDEKTGEEMSSGQAYLNLFLKGGVGGPATSRLNGQHRADLHEEEGILSTTSGNNWQMSYTENWIRQASTPGNKNVFDTTDFFVNRSYPAVYANLDRRSVRDTGTSTGDVYKFANHLDPDGDHEEMLTEMLIYGAAANLISPVVWQSVAGTGDYINNGTTDFHIDYYQTGLGGVLWDVPQFMNIDGYTLAPTLYFKPKDDLSNRLGADELLLSASYEAAVMGEVDPELRLTVTGKWGAFRSDLGLVGGTNGQFLEAEAGYSVTDSLSLNIGAALTKGETLRGKRNMPTGDSATWAGVQFSF